MTAKLSFQLDVWITPEDLERPDDDSRSPGVLLKDEIQSNLESLRGISQVVIRIQIQRDPDHAQVEDR